MVGKLAECWERPCQPHGWKDHHRLRASPQPPLERDSGEQEEELFSLASVTMATFPFVSLDPQLPPHLATGIQVRQLHDGVRKWGSGKTKLLEKTHMHTSRHREGIVRMSFRTSFHFFFEPVSVTYLQSLLNNALGECSPSSGRLWDGCLSHFLLSSATRGSSLPLGEVSAHRSLSQTGFCWHHTLLNTPAASLMAVGTFHNHFIDCLVLIVFALSPSEITSSMRARMLLFLHKLISNDMCHVSSNKWILVEKMNNVVISKTWFRMLRKQVLV